MARHSLSVSRKMYQQSENRRLNQARQLRKMRSMNNPNLQTVGSVAIGGALPAYLPNFGIQEEFFGVPTEGLIGAGLLYIAHMRKGKPEKKVIEGLAEGMIAVTAFKIAQKFNQ